MSFKNAKACFAENVSSLPRTPRLGKIDKMDALMWNLNKGLHSLTVAIEKQFDETDARIQRLEQALRQGR